MVPPTPKQLLRGRHHRLRQFVLGTAQKLATDGAPMDTDWKGSWPRISRMDANGKNGLFYYSCAFVRFGVHVFPPCIGVHRCPIGGKYPRVSPDRLSSAPAPACRMGFANDECIAAVGPHPARRRHASFRT